MKDLYNIFHKDTLCGTIVIDSENGALTEFKNLSKDVSPFLGNADLRLMKRWWEARAIPASRGTVDDILHRAGCFSSKEYLAKNLALSLTDTYWICPVDLDLKWRGVNLYNRTKRGFISYHNATSYDPNASLGGQMEKYWDMNSTEPVLVKLAYRYYGQQAVNELFATMLHGRQDAGVPYADYTADRMEDGGARAMCKAFTSESVEFVPAMEILDSARVPGNRSLYDEYISICGKHGLDEDELRDMLDYQTLSDFIISNTDEHLLNFGILRDTDTLEFISAAPLFDSGNSMFYDETRKVPFNAKELLSRRITAIHDSEEKMLRHVKNRMIVREDLLPTPAEVEAFYNEQLIPEWKSAMIAGSYAIKLQLLSEFQSGKTISLFTENHRSAE